MKERVYRVLGVILAGFLALVPVGCWGKTEVEELGFVLAIGIDPGSAPGTFKVTYQMGIPKKGDQGGGDIDNLTYSVEGMSMRDTLEKVYNLSDRKPFVGTVKVILIGEQQARKGINQVIDFFQRYYEFRRTNFIAIAKGSAADLLNVKTRTGKLPALSIQTVIQQSDMTSTFPVVRLGHYLTVLASASTAPVIPIAYPVKSGEAGIENVSEKPGTAEDIYMSGAGVLDGDRLADILTKEETQGYMWLQNEVKQRFITAKLQEEGKDWFASARILKTKTDWKLEETQGGYGIHYTIKGSWDLDEFYGVKGQLSPSEWLALVAPKTNAAFAEIIKSECEAALKKEQIGRAHV